jgi:hypothetical protein
MRLENVTAEIRPRSDWEAVDLGFALVRRDFWRCLTVWWLAVLVPTLLAGWWLWESPVLWLLLFWWWKPAASRVVLFELSRRLFGEKPRWGETLRQVPRAWTRRFFHRFILARLSPWLPVTLAVEDLEGLRGKAHKQRRQQLARRGDSAVMRIYLIADLAACWFGIAILMLVWMFIPEGQDGVWVNAIQSWDPATPMEIPLLILRTVVGCVMLAMSLTDVFVTGAGFGIYLNNRTWLEGWDVELAFRRLSGRIGGAALIMVVACCAWMPTEIRAAETRDPMEVIREVKADEAFKVHKVTQRVPKPRESRWTWDFSGIIEAAAFLGRVVMWLLAAALVAWLIWILWKNRRALRLGTDAKANPAARKARVVMGMEISPETLPADIPAAAMALWRQGRHHEALGLLYRGAISRIIETAGVQIHESDTEGDCLRRVEEAGTTARPDYFRGITGAWMRLAYARLDPDEVEIEALCRQWPFGERREA